MLFSKAGKGLLRRVRLFFQRKSVSSFTDFLFGKYQRLPRQASSESLTCPQKMEGVPEERKEGKVVGSFLNFGNIKDGLPLGVERQEESKVDEKGGEAGAAEKSREETCALFERKLKEMVMQHDDPQDWLDIQEFLYYYSRLTCPFYIDMVNRFFNDVCGSS